MVKKLVLPHFLELQLILALLTLVKSESGKLVIINEAGRGQLIVNCCINTMLNLLPTPKKLLLA